MGLGGTVCMCAAGATSAEMARRSKEGQASQPLARHSQRAPLQRRRSASAAVQPCRSPASRRQPPATRLCGVADGVHHHEALAQLGGAVLLQLRPLQQLADRLRLALRRGGSRVGGGQAAMRGSSAQIPAAPLHPTLASTHKHSTWTSALPGRPAARESPPVQAPLPPAPCRAPTLSMVVWLAMPMRCKSASGSKPSDIAFWNLARNSARSPPCRM